MASLRRVVALVQRFEAAAATSSPSSSQSAATGLCDAEVAEGTVRELIAKFNGMARSIPDFPRPAYARSTRAVCTARVAVLAELAALSAADPELRELLSVEDVAGGDETLALRCEDTERTEEVDDDLGSLHGDNEVDIDDEGGDSDEEDLPRDENEGDEEADECCDDDDNESLLTNDETASINSLSSSFVSDSSCDDSLSDAAGLYYELEYRSQARLHIQSEAESAVAIPEPIPVRVAPAKQERDNVKLPTKTTPRTLLPSRIPIRRGSTLRAPPSNPPKVAAPSLAAANVSSEPSWSSVASPPRSGHRCEPSVPRSPAARKTCPRCAATSSPSLPRSQPKRSARRGSSSDIRTQPSKTRVDSPMARRASITAPSARFHTASVSGVTTPANPPPSQPRVPSFVPINTRARSRSREASTRPPTPPVSSTLVALPTAEIRLDGIKSRLFDYENDPKRLEMVAANRARRKSREMRSSPAV